MHQHVNEPTRARGEDIPSILDLIFTRTREEIMDLKYLPLLGKSDHIVIGFRFVVRYDITKEKEEYKQYRLNFPRGNYDHLRTFFNEIKWECELKEGDVEKQYTRFCELYEEGVRSYIPKQ